MASEKKKIWKIILVVLLIVSLIITGISLFLGSHWKDMVQTHLTKSIRQSTNGLYHIKVQGLRIEVLKRRVRIEGIVLSPDSMVLSRLQASDSMPPLLAHASIDAIEVHGIKLLKSKKQILKLKKLWIDTPHIRVIYTDTGREQEAQTAKKSIYQIISPVFSSISMAQIRINNGKIDCTKWQNDTLFRLQHIDMEADHFLLDSVTNRRQVGYCNDIRLQFEDFYHVLPGGLFAFSLGKASVHTADSSLILDDVNLIPQYNRQHFAAKNPKHTNWMELAIGNIHCVKFDFGKLLFDKSLLIDSIRISDVAYTNMKNRAVEQAPVIKPMIYEYVQKAPLPITIRRVYLHHGTVIYEDLPRNKSKPGIVSFNKIESEFYNITNIVSPGNHYITVKTKAYVEREGMLNVKFKFPVDSLNNHFEITGTLGKMHLNRLNPIAEPFHVQIKDGMANLMEFNIQGNNKEANLEMLFLYEDLHLSLLKENNIRKNLLSGLANWVLFKHNPQHGDEPRRVKTVTQINPYRASFHYFWHTLSAGLQESIGITKKRREQLQWLKEIQSERKVKRAGRKAN